MAAELQPPEAQLTANTATTTAAAAAAATAVTTTVEFPVETENVGLPPAPKRQRRPSVRLGEIGDQPATLSYDAHVRRSSKHPPWRLPKDPSFGPQFKSIKARSLTNLVNGNNTDSYDNQEQLENKNQNGDTNLEFGYRKAKSRRATAKRVRSNWISKVDEAAEGDSREDGGEGFRDFDPDSDSPLKDHSPVHSADNIVLDMWQGHRRPAPGRGRVSETRENDAIEMENLRESDSRDQKCGTSDGVRSWLIDLGLSRFAPVFEIHEVDDEVLPMLTLEDLKDMGINAVGSRRKLYSAIQKLRKGFS